MAKTTAGKIAGEIGAGLAAAGAAAAAGYYFYGSEKAKQHRKIAAKWATDMKNEVVREAKRLKETTPQQFSKVVDSVAKSYSGVRKINATDVKRAARELKSNWAMVQKELMRTGKKGSARVAKMSKKAITGSKSTVKKIVKK